MATQPTLEQQLDALIAEHRLSSISFARISMDDGTRFWSVCVGGGSTSGSNRGACDGTVEAELKAALDDLNARRTRPVVVPELAPIAEMA